MSLRVHENALEASGDVGELGRASAGHGEALACVGTEGIFLPVVTEVVDESPPEGSRHRL